MPVASVVALLDEITEPPSPCDRFTNLSEDGLPFASCNVTVMVVVSLPFALTLVGLAVIPPAAAGAATNATSTCCCTTTPSVVSVAVNVTISVVASFTEKITAPFEMLDSPAAGVTMACEPALPASVTLLPLTVLPSASLSLATTNVSEIPSATVPFGSAAISETEALTAPGVLLVSAR